MAGRRSDGSSSVGTGRLEVRLARPRCRKLPNLAATLGLPIAADLRGVPRADWFTAGAWSELTITTVGSYDPGGPYIPDVPAPDASETELLEPLKAIGYVD